MSELRIALIMGGGVSLGSFSAGAAARVLQLLHYVERGPAKVDVVTGASAGSMTLAVLMYHLYRGSSLDDLDAALRRSWVHGISFDRLCPDPGSHCVPSLFSDAVVRSIAGEELRFSAWDPASPAHPYFAEGALVSFALTNLNGIPVRAEGQLIRQASGGSASGASSVFADALQTTFHDDTIRFALRREEAGSQADARLRARTLLPWTSAERQDDWRLFREAAIASGAFPAAFPPVRLPRKRSEYSIWPDELERDDFVFDYVDGGVLRNEPLKEAIELASARDEGADVERVFILIDPNVGGTRELYPLGFNQSPVLKEEVDEWGEPRSSSLASPGYMERLTAVVGRLGGVLAGQAAFRDWLRAARVNSQIEWRDDLLAIVDSLVPRAGSGAEEAVDALLLKVYLDKLARSAGAETEPSEIAAVRERIASDLRDRSTPGTPDFTARLHLLIDLVANLRSKRKINMVAITPASGHGSTPIPIAGNFLSNFGGFFNEAYRVYDFAVGEHLAAEVLTSSVGEARAFLRAAAPRTERPRPPHPDPSYRNLSWTIRQQFETLVANHARALAPLLGLPRVIHGIFVSKVRDRVRSPLVAERGGTNARFTVQIAGASNLFLRKGRFGTDVAADSDGIVRTVVAVRGGSDAEQGWGVAGPNLLTEDDGRPPRLELWKRRRLRPSVRVATVSIGGDAEGWLRRAKHCGVPVVAVNLDGRSEVTLTPEGLREEPYMVP